MTNIRVRAAAFWGSTLVIGTCMAMALPDDIDLLIILVASIPVWLAWAWINSD